jgi:hypothetical protein
MDLLKEKAKLDKRIAKAEKHKEKIAELMFLLWLYGFFNEIYLNALKEQRANLVLKKKEGLKRLDS